MRMFKGAFVYALTGCFLSAMPAILWAGSIKGKMQQRLNAESNIQYSGSQGDFSQGIIEYDRLDERRSGLKRLKEVNRFLVASESESLESSSLNGPAKPASLSVESSSVPVNREAILGPAILSPFAVYNVIYKAEIDENVVTVNGEVTFEVFKKEGWIQIPLVNNSVGLVDVKVNKGKSFVINQAGKYYLMIDKPGRYNLNIEFLIKANREREGGPGNFNVEVIPAPLSQFEFVIPGKEVQVFIEPSIKVETTQESERTVAWAIMPNTSSVNVRWTAALPKAEIVTEKLEPKVYAETSTTSSVGGGVIKNQSQIEYSILQSEISSLRVAFPEDISILSVAGDNLRDWKASKKDGTQYLDVFLNYGVKGKYVLNVTYERNIGEGSQVVEMPWLKAVGVERENGFYGIAASTNVELAVKSKDKATEIDTKQLPSSIWGTSSSPILLAFKYLNDGFKIELEITRHEELPVLIAAIDSANHIMLHTKDGKILTKVTYLVRNNVKQYLRLNLPKDVSIWSSFVSGAPVKPAKDSKGNILIPLQKSELRGQTLTTFPVEIVYLDKGKDMKPFGRMKLNLPTTDIPISECYWSVYLPDDYTYFNFDGDVKEIKSTYVQRAINGGVGGLMSRGVQGRVQGWSKSSVDNIRDQYEPMYLSSQSAADKKQIAQQFAEVQQGETTVAKGVLPIEINIPQQGKLYKFSKLLVVEGENPWLSVNYTSLLEKVKTPVKFVIYIALVIFVVRFLAKRIRRKKA